MNTLGLTPEQIQVGTMVEVCAAELMVAVGFNERALIDRRSGWTREIMEEAGQTLGAEILALLQPSTLHPTGIHQREVETLQTEYIEADNKMTDFRRYTKWPHEEHRPIDRVTARLGKKALRTALAQWYSRNS